MEITKEYKRYFEKTLNKVLDEKLKGFATKEDLTNQIGELARITHNGFANVTRRLDIQEARTGVLEKKMDKIERALHIDL